MVVRAALLVLACVLATLGEGCQPTDRERFALTSDLSREERTEVSAAVQATREWLVAHGDVHLSDFGLFAYADLNLLLDVLNNQGAFVDTDPEDIARFFRSGGAFAAGDAVYLYLGPMWRVSSASERAATVAHELVHVAQYHLAAGSTGYSIDRVELGPAWLIEGSAEWAAARVLDETGLRRFDDAQAERLFLAALDDVSLADVENASSSDHSPDARPYVIGFLAVQRLVQERGEAAFFDYFEALSRSSSWREAFQRAFGDSPEDFYARFDADRAGKLSASSGR